MEKETEKTLRTIGLTKNESSLYLAILKLGRTNVSSITKATGIHRRNVYDSLSTLLDKGLIFQIVGEKEGYYGGVEPNKLLELIQSKEISLAKIMPELKEKYQAQKVRETAVIYKGVEGFKDYLRDILKVGQDVYCLGAKGGWSYKKLGKFADWFERERIKKKIKVQNLFDHEMKKVVSQETPYAKYGECRFLPEGFSTNSAIDVFGDQVVTFTGLYTERFDDNVTLFVMQSRELAESYKTWFKFMWDASTK
ncbi:hypothetical protein KKG41_05765 [Patescibacteria group bacterium]|nr:hypothetical protein [Patescibacteria group bacterium]MBU1890694.1 hypothetical protein [Patescibacteria group bacterium]